MDKKDLKLVVGELRTGMPACLRFTGEVDEWSTANFNSEFLYVQEYVKPSKIIICINSEGGSVIYGMGTFSIIQDCPIDTETIVDGIAASMGSVIWAAGKKGYMRDYSILMIHNPFCEDAEEDDPDTIECTNAFKKQISKIYQQRFGLSEEDVANIMEGKEGVDGTYFDAEKAVEAGIIPASHVLQTQPQIKDKIKAELSGVKDAAKIRSIMSKVSEAADENKPNENDETIRVKKETDINSKINKTMDEPKKEKEELGFASVCDRLGMDKGTTLVSVTDRIGNLMKAEIELKKVNKELNDLKIAKEGVDTQLSNVNAELKTTKDALQVYKDAEIAKAHAELEAFIDKAVSEKKISADAKEKWMEMGASNFEMVKATIDSIPAQEVISKEIKNDSKNIEDSKKTLDDVTAEVAKKVEAVVGKDFKHKTLE